MWNLCIDGAFFFAFQLLEVVIFFQNIRILGIIYNECFERVQNKVSK